MRLIDADSVDFSKIKDPFDKARAEVIIACQKSVDTKMWFSSLKIRLVRNPQIGDKIYFVQKEQDLFEPCIVKDGFLLDPVHQRLSNAWTWLNLSTNETENGYGLFLEIFPDEEE